MEKIISFKDWKLVRFRRKKLKIKLMWRMGKVLLRQINGLLSPAYSASMESEQSDH